MKSKYKLRIVRLPACWPSVEADVSSESFCTSVKRMHIASRTRGGDPETSREEDVPRRRFGSSLDQPMLLTWGYPS